jgi:hypothetical protein
MPHLPDLMYCVILKVMSDDTLATSDKDPVVESPQEIVSFVP